MPKPNIVFVFADQWRGQATGYAGDPNVKTPIIDRLAQGSVNFRMALSGCPVCSPYRASLLTGQNPLTHGVFVNDVYLHQRGPSLADAFAAGGYDTAYIGKWHVDGHGRTSFIPPERQQGFQHWQVLECTHDYNHSPYFEGASPERHIWEGYDAIAQTCSAKDYLRQHNPAHPFLLVLSWGPPHNPYETAPDEFRSLYDPQQIILRPNVPIEMAEEARQWLAGYYAHCSALDWCLGELLRTLDETGLAQDTIFIFTSDHGDMLGSHGQQRKQRPWDESIRVPFLLRYPGLPGWQPREVDALIDAPDIMPTLLDLCDLPVPASVEGTSYASLVRGGEDPGDGAALLMCIHPFGEFTKMNHQGREYRGLRTRRYTYTRTLKGPWMLYDNLRDPYQQLNLVNLPEYARLQGELDTWLWRKLQATGDEFLPGLDYMHRWGYPMDETETVPIQ